MVDYYLFYVLESENIDQVLSDDGSTFHFLTFDFVVLNVFFVIEIEYLKLQTLLAKRMLANESPH